MSQPGRAEALVEVLLLRCVEQVAGFFLDGLEHGNADRDLFDNVARAFLDPAERGVVSGQPAGDGRGAWSLCKCESFPGEGRVDEGVASALVHPGDAEVGLGEGHVFIGLVGGEVGSGFGMLQREAAVFERIAAKQLVTARRQAEQRIDLHPRRDGGGGEDALKPVNGMPARWVASGDTEVAPGTAECHGEVREKIVLQLGVVSKEGFSVGGAELELGDGLWVVGEARVISLGDGTGQAAQALEPAVVGDAAGDGGINAVPRSGGQQCKDRANLDARQLWI